MYGALEGLLKTDTTIQMIEMWIILYLLCGSLQNMQQQWVCIFVTQLVLCQFKRWIKTA